MRQNICRCSMRRDHHKLTLDHLVWALLRHGIAVRVLDFATRPAALSADPAMDYFQGSVLDDSLVRRLISGADVVVHLAGAAEPMRYGNDPLATMGVNLTGSLNVVRRSAAFGVPVVFSSTSEVSRPQRYMESIRTCPGGRMGTAWLSRSRTSDGAIRLPRQPSSTISRFCQRLRQQV